MRRRIIAPSSSFRGMSITARLLIFYERWRSAAAPEVMLRHGSLRPPAFAVDARCLSGGHAADAPTSLCDFGAGFEMAYADYEFR